MKTTLLKSSLLLLVAFLALTVAACQKEQRTHARNNPKKEHVGSVTDTSAKTPPVSASTPETSQSPVSGRELSQTSAEIDAALAEIDSVVSEINRIDVSQDSVPNL